MWSCCRCGGTLKNRQGWLQLPYGPGTWESVHTYCAVDFDHIAIPIESIRKLRDVLMWTSVLGRSGWLDQSDWMDSIVDRVGSLLIEQRRSWSTQQPLSVAAGGAR